MIQVLDPSPHRFFMDNRILAHFLRILRTDESQSGGVGVQLLQTLNIMILNFRSTTAICTSPFPHPCTYRVCKRMCVYVCMCPCLTTCIRMWEFLRVYIYAFVHMWENTYLPILACVCVHAYRHACTCEFRLHLYVRTWICVHSAKKTERFACMCLQTLMLLAYMRM